MKGDITNYITEEGIDMELFLCSEILRLPSLHFGYWDGQEILNMENVKKAQERYNEELISHIPDNVETILDVGCGLGDISKSLSGRGFKVSALSPDKNHAAVFKRTPELQVMPFFQSKYEDLEINQQFDLILMSESQNYFDVQQGLEQTFRYLTPNGYLLICGMFRKEQNQYFNQIRSIEAEYIARAASMGFALIKRTDITANIIPTMQFAMQQYENILPAVTLANMYFRRSGKLKKFLVQWYFRKEIERAKVIHQYYLEYFDTNLFQKNVVYATHLYQKTAGNTIHPF